MIGLKGKKNDISHTTILIVGLVIVTAVLLAKFAPKFYSLANLSNILEQVSSIGIMAAGTSFVLVGGGMDISLSANLCCSSILGCIVMKNTGNIPLGILVIFLSAMLIGLVNGIAVSYLKMVPFIVTMSTMVIAQGLGTKASRSKGIYGIPDSFVDVLAIKPLGISLAIYVLIVFVFVYWLILNKSSLGRKIFAIGSNEQSAVICGINSRLVKLSTYLFSAFSAAVAAVFLTARLGCASMQMASDTTNMDIMCSAILGGVSIYGGKGNIWGSFVGACFIIVFNNIVNLADISFYLSLIIKGIVIITIIYWDANRSK